MYLLTRPPLIGTGAVSAAKIGVVADLGPMPTPSKCQHLVVAGDRRDEEVPPGVGAEDVLANIAKRHSTYQADQMQVANYNVLAI
jgi:hypothetical protein